MLTFHRKLAGAYLILYCFLVGSVQANMPEVIGTFGISPVEDNSAMAIWVPVPDGDSVEGITWFNNDGSVVFPEILAVAGEYGYPELLALATSLGSSVGGDSGQWCEYSFSQPVSSSSSGLYLMLRLPPGSDYEYSGLGGGSGLGYFEGSVMNNCWVTGDGVQWYALNPSYQMGLLPLLASEKTNFSLVLNPPRDEELEEEPGTIIQGNSVKTFPNPFNPNTKVSFVLNDAGDADLRVYDSRGRLVQILTEGFTPAGVHEVTWHGKDTFGRTVPSGVYFIRLVLGDEVYSSRCTLLK